MRQCTNVLKVGKEREGGGVECKMRQCTNVLKVGKEREGG